MKTLESIRTIEWSKLSEQKIELVKLVDSPLLDETVKESLDGIVNLLDHIQDFAVADGIAPQSIVFPPRDKNGKIIDLGDSVEVDSDGDDQINFDFSGTVDSISDEGYVVVVDQEENYYTVIESDNYLTLEE